MRRDEARFSEIRRFGDLRLLSGRYEDHAFAPHFHYCYSVGVVLEGAMRYRHCGREGVAPRGAVFLINPGEVHSGEGADGPWAFRSFYIGERRLHQLGDELFGPASTPPALRGPIVRDPELAVRLIALHERLESTANQVGWEPAEISTFATLLARHAGRAAPGVPDVPGAPGRPAFRERDPVLHARALIEGHFAEPLSLAAIAHRVGLSPFHFQRVFQDEVGLTPHRYLTQVRIERARAFLLQGATIAQTALACGFVDQSHLTRQFKSLLGLTPGAFLRACRGSSPFARSGTVEEWLARAHDRAS